MKSLETIVGLEYPEIKDNPMLGDTARSYAHEARIALETAKFRFNRAQDEIWGIAERERWLQAAHAAAAEFKYYLKLIPKQENKHGRI